MGVTFSTFDTTPAGAVAAIKAAILVSTDWSNAAGDRVVCTTTRGASMVVDLADAAAIATRLQFGVYRTTGLADKIIRYVVWRNSGGATSDTLHCVVTAGKDHLMITLEGPRAGEVNPDSAAAGSYRACFWLCDLVPYYAADTIPVVVCGGNTATGAPIGTTSNTPITVSRNATNTSSWVVGILETLQPGRGTPASASRYSGQSLTAGGLIARPYVVFEDVAGLRGRLAQFFLLGWNVTGPMAGDSAAQVFGRVTIGSGTYIGITPMKAGGVGPAMSAFASMSDSNDGVVASPVVAVPYS